MKKASAFLILFLVINFLVIIFITQERYIYFFDTAGYWIKYQDFGQLIKKDPLNGFIVLVHSVRHEHYNYLPVAPLVPFYLLFGEGRLPYILSIVNTYALPVVLLLFFFLKNVFLNASLSPPFLVCFLASIASSLLPSFWTPVLLGLPDVIGVLIILIILYLYFGEPIEKRTLFANVEIGSLLALLLLLRIWYAFWVVSFFIAATIERAVFNFDKYRFDINNFLISLKNLLVIGFIATSLFWIIATPFARQILSGDYLFLSAYRVYDSVFLNAKLSYHYYLGPLSCLLSLLGAILSLKDKKIRPFSLFLILQVIITFIHFTQTVTPNSHHHYLFVPALMVFISFFITRTLLFFKSLQVRIVWMIIFVGLALMSCLCCFVPGASPCFEKLELLFGERRHYPLVRGDLSVLNEILSTMDLLIKSSDGSIYVLASSTTFNEDILRNADRTRGKKLGNRILFTHHVDKRDGFPLHFFKAKYVLVAQPIQYHLRPEDQKVIGFFAAQILSQKGFGSFYEKLPYKFTLDNQVEVYIFGRQTDIEGGVLDEISREFTRDSLEKRDLIKTR